MQLPQTFGYEYFDKMFCSWILGGVFDWNILINIFVLNFGMEMGSVMVGFHMNKKEYRQRKTILFYYQTRISMKLYWYYIGHLVMFTCVVGLVWSVLCGLYLVNVNGHWCCISKKNKV